MASGFAKKLYLDTYHSDPWKKSSKKASQWPLLNKYLAQQRCSYLDYVLAERLLKDDSTATEAIAFFLCHIIMAAKEGHLCIRLDTQELSPSVDQLWQQDTSSVLSLDEIQDIHTLIIQGSQQLPSHLMTEISMESNCIDDISFLTPFCRDQNHIYLQRHWIFETLFLKHFTRHLETNPSIILDEEKVYRHLQEMYEKGIVLEEQAEAIRKGCCHAVSIITGGPGTGKTYTAAQLIKIFWSYLSENQKKECEIVVAAPTGKAVANLQKNLSKIVSEIEDMQDIKACTLHSLLEIRGSSSYLREKASRLTADFIIIDESSMIDVQLMAVLFESLKPGSRIILLGDPYQLPSVEAGSIFADVVDIVSDYREVIPCTQLKTCLRAELKSIIDFSVIVKQGLADQALDLLREDRSPGIHRLQLPLNKKEAHQNFIEYAASLFPSVIKSEMSHLELLQLFQVIRILSPMRKGLFGVDELNAAIWAHISKGRNKENWIAIPIMIITNDYRSHLFNGETGTLMKKFPYHEMSLDDYALFPSRDSQQEVRRVSAILLPRYEYAYCLSVHKSQGSEFDRIILVMPEGAEVFGREVFYTAITRARKQVDIYGTDHVLHRTIMQKGTRLSGINKRFLQIKAGKERYDERFESQMVNV